jgi:hypothetical protein
MLRGVADLVHADHHQAVQTAAIELVRDDAREDLPDRSPPDPHQLRDRRLGHLLRQERHHILEITRIGAAGAGPRHLLVDVTAARAIQPPEHALDLAATGAEIQMPPALRAMLLDVQAARSAARAHWSLAPQPDGHDHSLAAERDVLHRRSGKPEHPVECGGDSHVALLRRPLNFRHPAACRRRAAAGRLVRAQSARRTYTTKKPTLSRRFRGSATPDSPPDGQESRLFPALSTAETALFNLCEGADLLGISPRSGG